LLAAGWGREDSNLHAGGTATVYTSTYSNAAGISAQFTPIMPNG